ncbi:MAG: hypothetical protein GX661_03650 [Acholeplasmataceae bacterium]|nr:hypothetical protein [Acholeplasmataceae bacterium]
MGDQTYTVTLISKIAPPPYQFYDPEMEDSSADYHPIMEYIDSEGYRWVGLHREMHGDGVFRWGYYPPNNFKLLIMTEENQYYTSNVLERYAFASYFHADLTNLVGEGSVKIIQTVNHNYNYGREVLAFLVRLVLTIAIEIGLALLFGFKEKRQLIVILIVNAITQIGLNAVLNITTYFEGQLAAMFYFFLGEVLVVIAEVVFYSLYFKKTRFKAVLYGIITNLLSCAAGFGLYFLEQIIIK